MHCSRQKLRAHARIHEGARKFNLNLTFMTVIRLEILLASFLKMGESALKWKKIFRKILLGEEEEANSISDEKYFPSNENNLDFENKDNNDISVLKGKYCPHKDASSVLSASKSTRTKKFKSSKSAMVVSDANFKGNVKQYSTVANDKREFVPEWNKDFKNILGVNSSNKTECLKEWDLHPQKHDKFLKPEKNFRASRNFSDSVYKPMNKIISSKEWDLLPQKHSLKSGRNVRTSRNICDCVCKPKIIEKEECEAREFFARARTFKIPQYNLNDFDGSGVNLFKYSD